VLSKTVISRASLKVCIIFRACGCEPSGAPRRESAKEKKASGIVTIKTKENRNLAPRNESPAPAVD
jgi:hypothetical protein